MHTVREGGCFSIFLQMKMNCGTETKEKKKKAHSMCPHTHGCSVEHLPHAVTESTWNHVHWVRQVSSFPHRRETLKSLPTNGQTKKEPAPAMPIIVAL